MLRAPNLRNPAVMAGGLVLLLLVVFALWWLVTEPGRARSRAAQAELNARTATAAASSGAVAANVIAENAETDAGLDRLGREGSDAITKAPDAGVSVGGVTRSVRDGLCKLPEYLGDPLCVQRARGASAERDARRPDAGR